MACKMSCANTNVPNQRAHRDVMDRVVPFLALREQACVRQASMTLWEAVRAASMEDLLRAVVGRSWQ